MISFWLHAHVVFALRFAMASDSEAAVFGRPSILDKLKAPKQSELNRKRKVHVNAPPKGKRRARGEGANEPKSISASQRVREFPNESLTVSHNKLFCAACREELSLRKGVISSHVSSAKHKNGKERLKLKEAKERDIAKALAVNDEKCHPVGETLPEEQRVYRVRVLKTFLRAAVPLAKLHIFREILEENAFRLSDRRHMTDLVPFVLSQEQADVKREISGKPLSVIFDGTTRLGEAMVIVVRFIDEAFVIQQRLVRLQLLSKSMTGEEIARELIDSLSVQYSIRSDLVLATMRDRAACNNVAVRTLKVVYPTILDIGCFSHTLDLVGGKFSTPHLSDFVTWWISLYSHSPKAQLLWKERTGRTIVGFSATRWWSRWEVMNQLMELFGDVTPFLETNTDLSPNTRAKLLSVLTDPQQRTYLQVELAIIVDAGMPFVRATYELEGDGPLVLKCHEVISALSAAVQQAHYPNLQALTTQLFPESIHEQQQWKQYAISCVQPGLTYFTNQLAASMKEPLAAFKAARLFSPCKVQEMQPNAVTVDCLVAFPFLSNCIAALKGELAQYLAAAEDVDPTYDPLKFWKRHQDTLPAWSAAAKKVLLVQPSSAAAERVFSLLANSFGQRQQTSLQDYIETSLMLQYNSH